MSILNSNDPIIIKAIDYIRSKQIHFEETGHDWSHTVRVFNMANKIADSELCDREIVQLGALFHDIADSKFNNGDKTKGIEEAQKWLQKNGVQASSTKDILFIIANVSWSDKYTPKLPGEINLAIVQDADRLDAIGAIGIARAFNYGGYRQRPLGPVSKLDNTIIETEQDSTIEHFHKKLVKIRDHMNTKTGKEIAQERHEYITNYINRFYNEWYLA